MDQTIVDFKDIVSARLVIIDDEQTGINKFMVLNCTDDNDDYYHIAIPNVMVKKFTKEEMTDGESGAGYSGLSETAESEKEGDGWEEGNKAGDSSPDTGTASE